MDLRAYRESRGLSLEQAAAELRLSSAGHLSNLERAIAGMPLRLALQIEQWSGGSVRAVDLLAADDADLLRAAIERQARELTPA